MLGLYRDRFGLSVRMISPARADCDAHTMAIPLHNRMTPEDYQYVVETLHEIALSRRARGSGLAAELLGADARGRRGRSDSRPGLHRPRRHPAQPMRCCRRPRRRPSETFGFKWKKRDTFESAASLARMREWLVERYGDVAKAAWLADTATTRCWSMRAAAPACRRWSCSEPMIPRVRYLGVDVSEAVDVAARPLRGARPRGGISPGGHQRSSACRRPRSTSSSPKACCITPTPPRAR